MSDRRYDDAGYGAKGSVRRAREMMQAGLSSDGYTDAGRIIRGNQPPSQPPARPPPPVAAPLRPVDQSPRARNMAPPQTGSWPLTDNNVGTREPNRYPNNMSASPRQTPQRPPRPGPRNIPPPLDAAKLQSYTPGMPYRQPQSVLDYEYEDPQIYMQDFISAQGRSTDTGNDPFSSPERSPDYLQRSQYLGPPSSRRAGNSFYATSPNISPIPEESTESTPRKPISYASSRVIPSSWGTAPIDADLPGSPRESLAIGRDDEVGLVRQASLGTRGKPALRTINKPQSPVSETRRTRSESYDGNGTSAGATSPGTPATRGTAPNITVAGTITGNQHHLSNTHYASRLSSDSASSEESYDELEKPPIISSSQFRGSLSDEELKELERNHGNRARPTSNFSRTELKRPPPLNIDAVREAESRGSLTSLPDLIRRATKLASNLDRGRTASRLGMLDMLNNSGELNNVRSRNSGSISDILASFPPPGPIGTPTAGSRASKAFETRAEPGANPAENNMAEPKKPVRCCGMSRCAFVFIIFILFLLISSAVTIPIVLIVLPRQQEEGGPPTPTASLSVCERTHPCLNGGVSIGMNEDSCGCVCVNGFRGPRCAVIGDGSCGTIDISENYRNVTVGTAIPRLFENSRANFSIPLNTSKILSLFNEEDMSCTSENALVTFNGANRKRRFAQPILGSSVYQKRHGQNHAPVARRADPLPTIILNPSPTSTVAPEGEPFGKAPPPSQTSPPPVPTNLLDFSRIAVLLILQETEKLRSATLAHDMIQNLLKIAAKDLTNATEKLMKLKYDDKSFALDFGRFSIELGNGTVLGGDGVKNPPKGTS